jgi:hypothetical protein
MKRIFLGMVDVHFIDKDKLKPCGACKACCTTLGVQELHKPSYTPCQHECAKGCAIHGQHPASCKEFNCWWRAGMVPGLKRPDLFGIIVDSSMLPNGMAVVRVWEHKPGALQWAWNRKVIRRLKGKYRMVIAGTKDTWGQIWVETAPAPQRSVIEAAQAAGRIVFDTLMGLLGADKAAETK